MGLFGGRGHAPKGDGQRRESFRISVMMKGEIFTPGDKDCIHPTACEIMNLSGGGARLKTDFPFGKDVVLRLRMYLPGDPKPVLMPFRVVHSHFYKQNYYPYGYYHHGVRFCDPPRKDAQRVMQYLFAMERRQYDRD